MNVRLIFRTQGAIVQLSGHTTAGTKSSSLLPDDAAVATAAVEIFAEPHSRAS